MRPGAHTVRGTAAGCGLLPCPLGARLSTPEPRSSVLSSWAGPTCSLGLGLLSARGPCSPTHPRAMGTCPARLGSSGWRFCTLADLTAPRDESSVGSRGFSRGVDSDAFVGLVLLVLLWRRPVRSVGEAGLLCGRGPGGGPRRCPLPGEAQRCPREGRRAELGEGLCHARSSQCGWVSSVTAVPTTRRAKATGAAYGTWLPNRVATAREVGRPEREDRGARVSLGPRERRVKGRKGQSRDSAESWKREQGAWGTAEDRSAWHVTAAPCEWSGTLVPRGGKSPGGPGCVTHNRTKQCLERGGHRGLKQRELSPQRRPGTRAPPHGLGLAARGVNTVLSCGH